MGDGRKSGAQTGCALAPQVPIQSLLSAARPCEAPAVMIPTAKRAEQAAARDLAAAGEGTPQLSEDYRALVRRASAVGTLLSLLVLITILFMTIKP